MDIIGKRKIWFSISGVLIILGIFSMVFFGLNIGIDFKGGTLLELEFAQQVNIEDVKQTFAPFNLGNLIIQSSGEKSLIIKSHYIQEDTHQQIKKALEEKFTTVPKDEGQVPKDEGQAEAPSSVEATEDKQKEQEEVENENKKEPEVKGEEDANTEPQKEETTLKDEGQVENTEEETTKTTEEVEKPEEEELKEEIEQQKETIKGVEEIRYETVGPTIGKDLTSKAIFSLIFASLCIILYITWAFRKISKPVRSWKFGVCAILALIHDLLITVGIFSILGKFARVEINSFFVVAVLTIIGYSVNDTVVVFDRIRENLHQDVDMPFEKNVNRSVIQTIIRSLNTGLTTLFVLFVLFLLGGESIRWFVLALIVGFIAGTYSSIFIASPFLVVWRNLEQRFYK